MSNYKYLLTIKNYMTMKKLFLSAITLLACIAANAQSFSMTINDVEANVSEMELIVNMENGDGQVVAFNFDLYIPEGVSIATDEYGDYLVELSDRSQKHNLVTEVTEDGAIRFVSYSDKNREYKGTEGAIVIVPIKVDGGVGIYDFEIKNAHVGYLNVDEDISCEDAKATLNILPTSIKPAAAEKGKAECHDLLGRRVNGKQPGLIIRNGKVIVNK